MTQIQLGMLTLEPRRQLLADGRPLPIGRKALDILSALAGAGGSLVTKDELMAAVWPGLTVEENAIQVHVAALRKALGTEAGRLVTVRGLGYRLDLPSQSVSAAALEPSSVAVLPFENLTGDSDLNFLSDGIPEQLIADLARARGLRVASWRSSYGFKGRNASVREVSAQLGVANLVEGTVRRDGDHFRVNAHLVDAATGFQLWSDSFRRRADSLVALENELAEAIAWALSARLAPSPPATASPEAFELYLRARDLSNRPSPDNLLQAIELNRRAVVLDGNFARARACLAFTLCGATVMGLLGPETLAEAREAAQRAVAADPGLPTAHTSLGWLSLLEGDWMQADVCHRTATSLGTSDRLAWMIYGAGLLPTAGYLRTAMAHVEHALSLEPSLPDASVICAAVHWIAGDYDKAGRHAANAIELGMSPAQMPIAPISAEAALAGGDPALATERLAAGVSAALRERGAVDAIRLAHAAIADRVSAELAVAALNRFVRSPGTPSALSACPPLNGVLMSFYVRLGALDGAYRLVEWLLEEWDDTGRLDYFSLMCMWQPEMAAFRRDPRFTGLVERLGLATYWRMRGPPDLWPVEAEEEPAAAPACAATS